MSEKTDRRDVSQLSGRELSKTAFPAASKEAFRVYFDPKIHERIAAHAAEKLSLEICGVLVGDWHKDENGPYVLINEAVRADKAQSNAGDVTFTHEAWNEVNREMDTKFTDRKIVGWYHSHPNYGIFLSDRDLFCQDSTFNAPGHIAYVVDPVNGVEGVFCWRKGESKPLPHFWVGNEIHLTSKGKDRKPSSAALPETPAAPPPRQEAASPSLLMTGLLIAVCLLLGYLLGGMRSEQDRLQLVRDEVAYFGNVKLLKPGMRENLTVISENIAIAMKRIDELGAEHVALVGNTKDDKAKENKAKDSNGKDEKAPDPKEEKHTQWMEVLLRLNDTRRALNAVSHIYGLTPEETAEVQKLTEQAETDAAVGRAPPPAPAKPSGSESPSKAAANSASPPKSSSDKAAVPAPTTPKH